MMRNDVRPSKSEYRVSQGFTLPRTHGRFRPVFSEQLESKLKEHIQEVANLFGGLSRVDIRRLAFEFAFKNGIENNFNKVNRMAGKDWVRGFLKRHSDILLRIRAESNRIQHVDLLAQLEKNPGPMVMNDVKEEEILSPPSSTASSSSPLDAEDVCPTSTSKGTMTLDQSHWLSELAQLQSPFLKSICCEICTTPPWFGSHVKH